MAKKSIRKALQEALQSEMRRDPNVVVIGEDVAGGAGSGGERDSYGGAMGAELTNEILVERTNGDAHTVQPILIGPVHDVDHIIIGERKIHRIPEARTTKLVTAH